MHFVLRPPTSAIRRTVGMSLVGLTRNTSSTHPQFGNKLRVVNLRFGFAMLRSAGTPVRPTPWVYLVATIEQVRSIFPVDSFDDASVSGPVSLPKPLRLYPRITTQPESWMLCSFAVETKAIILFDLFHHCVCGVLPHFSECGCAWNSG